MPNRQDLDDISTEVPIMITRACGHCCVVNSRVLALAGITADTPAPEGGSIGMTDGQPDGRLCDNAMELLEGVLPLPGKEELKQMIRLACRTASASPAPRPTTTASSAPSPLRPSTRPIGNWRRAAS